MDFDYWPPQQIVAKPRAVPFHAWLRHGGLAPRACAGDLVLRNVFYGGVLWIIYLEAES